MDSLLRHTLATLNYRLAKTLRDAPEDFSSYRTNPPGRTPVQLLAHIGDLMDWARSMSEGKPAWHDSEPLAWPEEVNRCFRAIQALDAGLAANHLDDKQVAGLFQGPIADALTHSGQLGMLRRLSGAPIKGENYFVAEIVAGRLGPDQAPPRIEF